MSVLKATCDQVVVDPNLKQKPDGTTFCNVATRRIAEAVGFSGITDKMLANEIITFLAKNPSWREVAMDLAQAFAVGGGFAVVAMSDAPHGHIATLYPAPAAESGSWGQKVPIIANVGKANGIMRLSGAFRAADKAKLRYFVYG